MDGQDVADRDIREVAGKRWGHKLGTDGAQRLSSQVERAHRWPAVIERG